MVWENEIDASAVNVEDLAEMRPRHGRAFDVPPRPPLRRDAGRRGPAGLSLLRRLPKDEVHGVALVRSDIDTRSREHLVERAIGERAIAWKHARFRCLVHSGG